MYRVVLRALDTPARMSVDMLPATYDECCVRLVELGRTFDWLHEPGCRAYLAVEPELAKAGA